VDVNLYLVAAAVLIAILALAHSVLGEWLLLGPLFTRGDVPKLIGSRRFAKRTLRFAWHLTTVLMWGTAAILIAAADPATEQPLRRVARMIAVVYLVCAVVAGIGSRWRHFSWLVFLISAVLVWLGVIARA
jgi:hypothetical protein